jgi:glycosyltransferase involved in cell wall biosynthesis
MLQTLYFDWAISTLFGWGVYGLNLLRHWSAVANAPAYSLSPIHLESLAGMDPLGLRAIAQKLVDSDQLRLRRALDINPRAPMDGIVLHSLGNRFMGSSRPGQGGQTGAKTAGVIFFEDATLPDAMAIANEYDLIVTGSTWCEAVLRARGVHNVSTVLQGIDPSLFHPAPRAGSLASRFAVFSGGKMERRKAQDIVLLAFRIFAARHQDAVLVTSWHSPWPIAALTMNANSAVTAIELTQQGQLDPTAWAVANGISPNQFIDLGVVPNHLMARVLWEMDVALFPNRCEGGTNLVAMESMACGVPAIIADNTGQRDLIATGAPYPLSHQGKVLRADGGTDGWGECDVEEVVAALEHVYTHREEACQRGLAGARAMQDWSWRNQIGRLHTVLTPVPQRAMA